ncbi:hypothetical protein [Streptomyces sp. NPDC029041]|uniref:hypothetical protein n=1 Tax=Streptomyces sp. NPDC029041 TaxID=3155727 RepID=UPI0033E28762
MTTPVPADSARLLAGMYAAEAQYFAAGGPGEASFGLLAPIFFPVLQTITVKDGRITEVRPFYWDSSVIAAACAEPGSVS